MMTRLLDPTAGTIRFAGQDIARSRPALCASPERARLQLVFQDPTDSLNPRFTAFAAIAEPLRRLGRRDAPAGPARVALACMSWPTW